MQVNFALLRDAEIVALQETIEREHGHLQLLFIERAQDAASGRVTEGFRSRERAHTTMLRKLYRAWVHWQSRGATGEARLEASEEQVLEGAFPWEPSGQAGSRDALLLSLYKALSELTRSKEERMFLQRDCVELVSYYDYQRHLFLQLASAHGTSWSPGHVFLVLRKLREIRDLLASACRAYGSMLGDL